MSQEQGNNIGIKKKCYMCDTSLTVKNSSKEHIIPNALGGRLKPKILCKMCNNKFGKDVDAKLVNTLSFFSNFLNPPRDRKQNPPIDVKIGGLNARRYSDGIIQGKEIKVDRTDSGLKFHISFVSSHDDSHENAYKEYEKIIDGVAKSHKWPKEKVEDKKNKAKQLIESSTKTIEEPIVVISLDGIGKKEDYLAIIKMAINYYIHNSNDSNQVKNILKILKDQTDNFEQHVSFYLDNIAPNDSIYHAIFLKGDSKEGILYSIISLFSTVNFLVLLNDKYNGDDFENSYTYDLRNQKELETNSTFNYTKKELLYILKFPIELANKHADFFKDRLSKFLDFFVAPKSGDLSDIVLEIITNKMSKEAAIYTKAEFEYLLQNKLIEDLKEIKYGKFLKEIEIENLTKLPGLYEEYIQLKFPAIIQQIFYSIIGNQVVNNLKEITGYNKTEFIKYFKNKLISISTNNSTVNSLLPIFIKNNSAQVGKLLNDFYYIFCQLYKK